ALALLHPHYVVAAAAAPTQATATLCSWQPPCQGAATAATGATAPVGGRAGSGRQPLVGCCPCERSPLVGGLTWPPLPRKQCLLSLPIAARRTVLRDSISSHAV
ncbi:hypothetical protein BHM03_00016964, partial [Ensete ventricosum]